MRAYLIRRGCQAILVILGVTIVVFAALHIGADPAEILSFADATQEEVDRLREALGLNEPLFVQYVRFLGRVVRGDFGESFRQGQPAFRLVVERLPATVELAAAAMIITILVAIPVGIISAVRPHATYSNFAMFAAILGQSMPVFWLGIMLILAVSVKARLLPTGGRGGIQHLVLPGITLALYQTARTARLVRSCMLEVMGHEFINTARAKGLSERAIVWHHALKNAMGPVITILGLDLGRLLGGAVITETVFAWPGMGRLAVQSIYNRDYPVVEAIVVLAATGYVIINLGVDVLYHWLNPQVRVE